MSAAAQPAAITPPTASPPPAETLPAITLILPGADTPFARAAEAVRAGFFAAHAAAGAPMAIQVLDTDGTPVSVIAAINAAAAHGARMVVGPLTRDAVDAVVRIGGARLPVLALNVPSTTPPLPKSMLALGLRVEDEARSVVRTLLRQPMPAGSTTTSLPFAVVTGSGNLERRAGAAFVDAVREHHHAVETFQFSMQQARISALAQRLSARPWRAILLALGAGEAAALRPWLPADAVAVATSRVHLIDPAAAGLAPDLEGLAFVDMPWLVEPDHPAVAAYPRPATPYSAELDRLYALGIDAYRIAARWLKGDDRFEIDGVTGWLRVDPALGGRVERLPVMAVFVDGKAERRDVVR